MINCGSVLAGRYRVLECIGKGGTSNVYKCFDMKKGKTRILKKYKEFNKDNVEETIKNLERELDLLKSDNYPGIVSCDDLLMEKNTFYLVLEEIDGITLEEYLRTKRVLSQKEVVNISIDICKVLFYLHSMNPPIVYRDIKPDNVMILKDGSIKLIDFGSAKRYKIEQLRDTRALGTWGYAAPEQIGDEYGNGLYNTDIRTDIFGVGVLMLILSTGERRRGIYTKEYKAKQILLSGKFKKTINKCTRTNPKERYRDTIELLCDLYKCKSNLVSKIFFGLKLNSVLGK